MPCETPEKPNAALKPNHGPISTPNFAATLLLHNDGVQALRVLNVDGLNVAVELLLGALLVVAPPGDADAEPVRNALDTLLPDLLVQLGVQTNVGRALRAVNVSVQSAIRQILLTQSATARLGVRVVGLVFVIGHTMALVANALSSLIARGALFLKVTPWSCPQQSVSEHAC